MGRFSVVPQGAIVDLYCIVRTGKSVKGFFTYEGKKYFAPIRLLWKVDYIDVAAVAAPILTTRDSIGSVKLRLEKAKRAVLDFQNVEFVSRSAAHAILLYLEHSGKEVELINMNPSVKKMFELVRNQLAACQSSQ